MKLTFKQFLSEATVKDSVNRKKTILADIKTEEEAKAVIKLLRKNCKVSFDEFLKSGFAIYRGMSEGPKVIQVQYNKGVRKTQNTHDYYRMIIDTHPMFQGTDLPKRSRALIASTNYGYARGYGDEIFAVFPFDTTIIGLVPAHDIFEITFKVFDRDDGNVDNLSIMINRIFTLYEKHGGRKIKQGVITPEDFIKNIDSIGMERVVNILQNGWAPFIRDEDMGAEEFAKKYGIDDGKSFLDYLYNKVLSPNNLKFKALLPENFYKMKPRDKEVWIGDKCIAVSTSVLADIKRMVDEK